MNIGEIMKDSLKYPLSDWKKLLIFGIIIVFANIYLDLVFLIQNYALLIVLGIIGIIFGLFAIGYMFKIIKSSLKGINKLPEFNNWKKMFINGIKILIINIIYLIPVILVGFPHFIALLYVIMIIPVILMAIANMANNNGKLSAAFKFNEIISNVSKLYWDRISAGSVARWGLYIPIVIGFFIFDDILERISSIGWKELIIWYIVIGIISLILILIGYFVANITSILILKGLALYSILNYIILQILIFSLVLLPYLFIFLSRSTALIYNSAIKSYLISENESLDKTFA